MQRPLSTAAGDHENERRDEEPAHGPHSVRGMWPILARARVAAAVMPNLAVPSRPSPARRCVFAPLGHWGQAATATILANSGGGGGGGGGGGSCRASGGAGGGRSSQGGGTSFVFHGGAGEFAAVLAARRRAPRGTSTAAPAPSPPCAARCAPPSPRSTHAPASDPRLPRPRHPAPQLEHPPATAYPLRWMPSLAYLLGHPNVTVYDGSMAEWVRDHRCRWKPAARYRSVRRQRAAALPYSFVGLR